MQLIIHHRVDIPLQMDISYHHVLQAIIYRKLQEISPEYGMFLHENGFRIEKQKRVYKLFTFSELQGHYDIVDGFHGMEKGIRFDTEVSWEIRSPDLSMIWAVAEGIRQNGITYGKQTYHDIDLKWKDETVEGEILRIRMIQPLVVYMTNPDTGQTIACSPDMPEFQFLIQENFVRKYRAAYGTEPRNGILITPIPRKMNRHRVSYFKGTRIDGWTGEYFLAGERKYLDFLFQTGLGSKNSQGFGMFRVLESFNDIEIDNEFHKSDIDF